MLITKQKQSQLHTPNGTRPSVTLFDIVANISPQSEYISPSLLNYVCLLIYILILVSTARCIIL